MEESVKKLEVVQLITADSKHCKNSELQCSGSF